MEGAARRGAAVDDGNAFLGDVVAVRAAARVDPLGVKAFELRGFGDLGDEFLRVFGERHGRRASSA